MNGCTQKHWACHMEMCVCSDKPWGRCSALKVMTPAYTVSSNSRKDKGQTKEMISFLMGIVLKKAWMTGV